MHTCNKCRKWQTQRLLVIQQLKEKGLSVKAQGMEDSCVCHLMTTRQKREDRELLILK